MSISDEIYTLCKLYYGPREGFPGTFYIRENSPLFPKDFPLMKGNTLGKGSFYQTEKVIQNEDSIVVEIDVHVKPHPGSGEKIVYSTPEEFIIYQKDIFTWDEVGNVFVLVEYRDSEQGPRLAKTEGKLIKYSEEQWTFDFEAAPLPECPIVPQPWNEEVKSCSLKVLHTDTLVNNDVTTRNTVYNYDLMYIAFLNEEGELLGTQKVDPSRLMVPDNPFLNATSNKIIWEQGI